MARTIGRAQAEAIADGFLDSLGERRSDFKPDNSLAALVELAAMIIENAVKNLNSGGHVSSGKLGDSIKVKDPQYKGGKIQLDIEALYYYLFLNKGVKGTKSGSSTDGFKFKYALPSKKMVSAIAEWLETSHKVTVHLRKPHSISKKEVKDSTLSDIDSAYMLARSIVTKGIKRNSFFDKAVQMAQQYSKEMLGKALVTDVINTLPKKLNDGDSNKK